DPNSERSPGNGPGGTGGSFAQRVSAGRSGAPLARPGDGVRQSTYAQQVRTSRRQPGLFDTPHTQPSHVSPPPPTPPEPSKPAERDTPARQEATNSTALMASGEKTKARDIIAAIRTLKAIEQDKRPATAEDK